MTNGMQFMKDATNNVTVYSPRFLTVMKYDQDADDIINFGVKNDKMKQI